MSAWWTALPAAELHVECGGQQHLVRWSDGALRTPDHDDPDGERTLAALGGEASACIQLLDAWTRHADDLQMLVLASRGPADPLAAPEPLPSGAYGSRLTVSGSSLRGVQHTGRSGWFAYAPRARMPRRYASYAPMHGPQPGVLDPADEWGALLTLGGGLADRLVGEVAATWTDRIAARDDRVAGAEPALQAALYGRVLAALRDWLGEPDLDLSLTMCPPDAERSVTRDQDGVRVTLPFAWLAEVWVAGFATIAGRFCLGRDTADDALRLRTVGPDFGAARVLTLDVS